MKIIRFTRVIILASLFSAFVFSSCGPKDPLSKARQMIKDGKYTEAISLLSALENDYKSSPEYFRLLGDAYYERARHGQEVYLMDRPGKEEIEDFKKAVSIYEKAQKLKYSEDISRRRTRIMGAIGPYFENAIQ